MSGLILPVTLDGERITISQGYGDDFAWKGYSQYYRGYYGLNGHNGIDFGGWGIDGEPVNAAGDGTVVYAGRGDYWDSTVGGGSFTVVIHHPHLGVWTAYLHLRNNSNTLNAGQRVKQGQMIARAGNTGIGTGAHLHFQVMPVAPLPLVYQPNWGCVNPKPYMQRISAQATIKPASSIEDIMATLDKEDYANIAHAVWAYDQQGKTHQAWHFQKNLATVIWGYKGKGQKRDAYWHLLNVGTNLLNTKIKNGKGVAYRWISYIVNDNQNAWDTKRLLETLAKKNGVSVAEIEAALSGVLQAEMPELLAENAVDVEVTINPKEKI